MKRLVVVVGMVLGLWSCSGDDASPVGQYAEQCDPTTTCADGLQCIFNMCTASCTTQEECRAWSSTGICMGGTCFDSCVDTFNCPPGLGCNMVASTSGTCRVR